jgi:hypothetical protein
MTCSASAAGPVLSLFKKADVNTPIPMQIVASADREAVKYVFDNTTLSAKSQPDLFTANSDVYMFFLDHPDRAVSAWRDIGAKCVDIHPRPNKQFAYTDDKGSEIVWRAVVRRGDMRVWYAEGKVKASPLPALVPLKAVAIIRHGEITNPDGTVSLVQRTEMYIHTDSVAVSALMKVMGPQAERYADQGLDMFQTFFSRMSTYMSRDPEYLRALVRQEP